MAQWPLPVPRETDCMSTLTLPELELDTDRLVELPVPLPPLAVQDDVVQRLRVLDDVAKMNDASAARLLALWSGLVDDLVTGRVRVPR